MPPKKCPKCLVTHGDLFVSSWTNIHGQIKRTRLRSIPRVRPDWPRGASPGVKTKTDWLDWPYHDVANDTSAKLPSESARARARGASLVLRCCFLCLSLLFLRCVVTPEKTKICAQSVPSVCVFDLHSSHS